MDTLAEFHQCISTSPQTTHIGLEQLNQESTEVVHNIMRSCCESDAYVWGMLEKWPFSSESNLYAASDTTCATMGKDEWMRAICAQAEIGQKKKSRWSTQEQAVASKSNDETLDAIRLMSRHYTERHGFIFMICATGKSGEEILAILKERLKNQTEDEFEAAVKEHMEIIKIRLAKALKEYGLYGGCAGDIETESVERDEYDSSETNDSLCEESVM